MALITRPEPLHFGHGLAFSCPVPLHCGQTSSPVPAVPGAASSPGARGFVPAAFELAAGFFRSWSIVSRAASAGFLSKVLGLVGMGMSFMQAGLMRLAMVEVPCHCVAGSG